jgi:hypothetical protein
MKVNSRMNYMENFALTVPQSIEDQYQKGIFWQSKRHHKIAEAWFRLAAKNGHQGAVDLLNRGIKNGIFCDGKTRLEMYSAEILETFNPLPNDQEIQEVFHVLIDYLSKNYGNIDNL